VAETTSAPGGNPPDKNSLGFNSEGKLTVIKPSEIVIGDFEASFPAGWSIDNVYDSFRDNSENSPYSEYYGFLEHSDASKKGISLTKDLTDFGVLKVVAKFDVTADSSSYGFVDVGGTEKINEQDLFVWKTYEVDISNQTGDTEIKIGAQHDGGGGFSKAYIDGVRLARTQKSDVTSEAGN
jgi:hypothetical protein